MSLHLVVGAVTTVGKDQWVTLFGRFASEPGPVSSKLGVTPVELDTATVRGCVQIRKGTQQPTPSCGRVDDDGD